MTWATCFGLCFERSVPFGKYCLSSPVEVLVRAALPGAGAFGEEHGDSGGAREFCVDGHLDPLVPGQRAFQVGRESAEGAGAGKITWDEWTESWMSRQAWVAGTYEAATTSVQSVPWRASALSSVKASHVQSWVSGESKRGLAPSTIRTRLNYVQMSFRAAVADRLTPASTAVGVKPPRLRRAESSMRILTIEQIRKVLEVAGDFRPFVEVCLYAGLRLGEAAGLQLGDINFLGRSISISRQVQGATHTTATLVAPKYGSERMIFVPAELTSSLAAHVAQLRIEDLGEQMFRTPLGRLWNRNNAGAE